MKIAHISDLHISDPRINLTKAFFDFTVLSGVPLAVRSVVKTIRENKEERKKFVGSILRIPQSVTSSDLKKIAFLMGLSMPAVYYLYYQYIKFHRISLIRKDQYKIRNRLIEDIDKESIDHVVFTGDITNTAFKSEFIKAAEFLGKLKKNRGLTLLPGNHDIMVRALKKNSSFLKEDKLKNFFRYFQDVISDDQSIQASDKENSFPRMDIIGDRVCIISLDSTAPDPVFNNRGYIADEQIELLAEICRRKEVRKRFKILALHHHLVNPPGRIRTRSVFFNRASKRIENMFMTELENRDELLSIAKREGIRIILHGHKHQRFTKTVDGISVFCAGATTHSDRFQKKKPGYFIFDIQGDRWQVTEKNF